MLDIRVQSRSSDDRKREAALRKAVMADGLMKSEFWPWIQELVEPRVQQLRALTQVEGPGRPDRDTERELTARANGLEWLLKQVPEFKRSFDKYQEQERQKAALRNQMQEQMNG